MKNTKKIFPPAKHKMLENLAVRGPKNKWTPLHEGQLVEILYRCVPIPDYTAKPFIRPRVINKEEICIVTNIEDSIVRARNLARPFDTSFVDFVIVFQVITTCEQFRMYASDCRRPHFRVIAASTFTTDDT